MIYRVFSLLQNRERKRKVIILQDHIKRYMNRTTAPFFRRRIKNI
jgi:hypothetical protein